MKLAGLFFLLAWLALPAERTKQFLVVADIHFNPLADPALAKQLAAAEPDQWEEIFRQEPASPVQHYGDDSTWRLFSALISGLQDVQPKPGLILVTGDSLPHRFQERFASATGSKDAAAYRVFVKKTFAFVSLELEKAAGGARVIYTLGNNDQECGDYELEPNGPFLEDTAGAVEKLAHFGASDLPDWRALGSYTVINPLVHHGRIIALNTNFWSRRYTNTCGDKASQSADPGAAVLTWLSNQLREAERQNLGVWLVYHIPPGIDGHSSARANQVVTMWKQSYSDGFNELLDKYRKTIDLNIASHTHLDDIRLVKTAHATTLVLINPGVSPNVGQNPAFRVMTVDSHGKAKDLMTYYMPSLETMRWQLEYSARPAYGLKRIDAASYQALYSQIDESRAMADKWKLFYSVSRPDGLADSKTYLRSLYCATGNTTPDGYQACVSAGR